MANTIQLKVNVPLLGVKAGDILKLECDSEGTPFDKFWRRRLIDAKTDNCCEIVQPEPPKPTKKPKKERNQ